jgi:predicted membrane protein (TIGR00267 family)
MTPPKFLKDIIFGAEDGLVSILGLVLGTAVGSNSNLIVILAGVSGVLSGALSMAAGDYLASKGERESYLAELKKRSQEIYKNPLKVAEELREAYKKEGFTEKEIEPIIKKLLKNKELMLKKIEEELINVPGRETEPGTSAIAIFSSYIFFSIFPILPFTLFDITKAIYISAILTSFALFTSGVLRAKYFGGKILKSGAEMFLIGIGSALIGYLIGFSLQNLLNISIKFQ